MSSKSFDDAYYAQALSGIKEQLSNWILKHESIIQPNIAHLPVEAFSGLNLAFSEVKSSQIAELYKKSSFFRTSLLQQYVAQKICHDFLSGAAGPANLQEKMSDLPKFFTADYDFGGLRKRVLVPCIELASKMLQETRILVPMMIPAGTLFDTKYCNSIHSKSSSEPVLFCQFPLVAAKQGPNSYVVSKAPVNMVSEWSFATAPKFTGAITGAGMLAGLEAIEYKPKPAPAAITTHSGSGKERSTVSEGTQLNSDENRQLTHDVYLAHKRASKFKKVAIALAVLSLLLLAGLIAAAAVRPNSNSGNSGTSTKGNNTGNSTSPSTSSTNPKDLSGSAILGNATKAEGFIRL